MNNHNKGSAEGGPNDLGWLVRCKTGCEGIVHDSVPCIGDPCPLCTSEHADKPCITYCVKIATAGDTYEQMSMEGGISLEGDVVQAWDVDLGSFLTGDHSEDSTLRLDDETGDLCGSSASVAEGGESEKVYGTESKVRQTGMIWQDIENSKKETNHLPEQDQHDTGGDDSTDLPEAFDGVRFNRWHVLGLICCAVLLLIGGLLTFDVVRVLYSPSDTIIASPILRVLR